MCLFRPSILVAAYSHKEHGYLLADITFSPCIFSTCLLRWLAVVEAWSHLEQGHFIPSFLLLTWTFMELGVVAAYAHLEHGYLIPLCLISMCVFLLLMHFSSDCREKKSVVHVFSWKIKDQILFAKFIRTKICTDWTNLSDKPKYLSC